MLESSSSGNLYILERLLEIIYHTNPTDKVVVVSIFTSAITVIETKILIPKKWSSIRLNGTTEQSVRQTLVNSFNRWSRDSSFVFLLSSKAGGCGLNLIGANRLLMLDLGKHNYIKDSWLAYCFNSQVYILHVFIIRLESSNGRSSHGSHIPS